MPGTPMCPSVPPLLCQLNYILVFERVRNVILSAPSSEDMLEFQQGGLQHSKSKNSNVGGQMYTGQIRGWVIWVGQAKPSCCL
jgi:hypothetical protein